MIEQETIHDLAVSKGWWESENVPEKIALIHSELSEALEEYRQLEADSLAEVFHTQDGKPCGFGIELADVVIRVMDLCAHLNIDLETMIEIKHEYNKTRSYRHGGKRA